jgi:hypothetical protein
MLQVWRYLKNQGGCVMGKFNPDVKKEWAEGPWQQEPDRLEWRYNGVPCLIVRNMMGALCGYAAVGPTHPWYGSYYGDCVAGCKEIPQQPIEDLPNMKIPQSLQERHLEMKNYPCRENRTPDHSPETIVEVHGGLTFSGPCQEGGAICHRALPGEPTSVWWFGFDCAHAGDVVPEFTNKMFRAMGIAAMSGHSAFAPFEKYRDIAYVKNQVEYLATQLLHIGKQVEPV